jgi:regulator of cell morphogenesis and NO signaling
MMSLNAAKSVREFATEIPHATRIFEKLGIDYCCGGAQSLRDACGRARVPLDEVLSALERGSSFKEASEFGLPDFADLKLKALIEHILARHHAYVKQELPRLQQLLKKVVAVHGASHPELGKIQEIFLPMSA